MGVPELREAISVDVESRDRPVPRPVASFNFCLAFRSAFMIPAANTNTDKRLEKDYVSISELVVRALVVLVVHGRSHKKMVLVGNDTPQNRSCGI